MTWDLNQMKNWMLFIVYGTWVCDLLNRRILNGGWEGIVMEKKDSFLPVLLYNVFWKWVTVIASNKGLYSSRKNENIIIELAMSCVLERSNAAREWTIHNYNDCLKYTIFLDSEMAFLIANIASPVTTDLSVVLWSSDKNV